jgi:hypothetical protein
MRVEDSSGARMGCDRGPALAGLPEDPRFLTRAMPLSPRSAEPSPLSGGRSPFAREAAAPGLILSVPAPTFSSPHPVAGSPLGEGACRFPDACRVVRPQP